MNNHRPSRVIAGLVVTAVAGFVGTALLDVHGNWGQPRQAAANVLWIVFLLSVVALVVVGLRMMIRRRSSQAA